MQPVAEALRSAHAARGRLVDSSSRRREGERQHQLVVAAADAALLQAAECGDLQELQALRSKCCYLASEAVNASVQERWRELRTCTASPAASCLMKEGALFEEDHSSAQPTSTVFFYLSGHAESRLEARIEEHLLSGTAAEPAKWLKKVCSFPATFSYLCHHTALLRPIPVRCRRCRSRRLFSHLWCCLELANRPKQILARTRSSSQISYRTPCF